MDDNPIYPYSAIVRRPRLALPDGRRLAVWIGIATEHYTYGTPALSLAQFTAQLSPDPLNYGWRDYGPRVGIWRLMEVFDSFGLRATSLLNSEVCRRHPEIIEEGGRRDWCWVAHGANNSEWPVGMKREDEQAYIARVTAEIESATGHRPRGWLGPALTESPNTTEILAELGYDYSLNWGMDDEPVPMRARNGAFISVPYSAELNDIPAFTLQGQSAADFRDAIVDQFDQLLAEGSDRPRIMGFGIHPFLTGQPYRTRQLIKALEHMTAHRDDVWFTTSDEVASWYLDQLREAAVDG